MRVAWRAASLRKTSRLMIETRMKTGRVSHLELTKQMKVCGVLRRRLEPPTMKAVRHHRNQVKAAKTKSYILL